jgi:MraZ protein
MFLGEYEHSLDDKGRLTIPAKYRNRLANGLVVTKGIDRCLWLFPSEEFERLASKVTSLKITDPDAREFQRELFSGAADLHADNQGRIRLEPWLRTYAGIDSQAMIVGLYNYVEIWAPSAWRERQERSYSDPEARAEQFARLGI